MIVIALSLSQSHCDIVASRKSHHCTATHVLFIGGAAGSQFIWLSCNCSTLHGILITLY
jgi:hypothetical protein